MAASISNPARGRVYDELSRRLTEAAGASGSIVYDTLAMQDRALDAWIKDERIQDDRVDWLLGTLSWKDGVFRNAESVPIATVLATALNILAYRDLPPVVCRPSADGVLVAGRGAGTLRWIENPQDLARADIPPDTILVSEDVFRMPYPVVAGLILTRRVNINGAHNLGLLAGMRSPMICMPDEANRLQALAERGDIQCEIDATGSPIRFIEEVSPERVVACEHDKRPPLSLESPTLP